MYGSEVAFGPLSTPRLAGFRTEEEARDFEADLRAAAAFLRQPFYTYPHVYKVKP